MAANGEKWECFRRHDTGSEELPLVSPWTPNFISWIYSIVQVSLFLGGVLVMETDIFQKISPLESIMRALFDKMISPDQYFYKEGPPDGG